MNYRRFGRTELNMPVFSCGGMRYQFKWQSLPEDGGRACGNLLEGVKIAIPAHERRDSHSERG